MKSLVNYIKPTKYVICNCVENTEFYISKSNEPDVKLLQKQHCYEIKFVANTFLNNKLFENVIKNVSEGTCFSSSIYFLNKVKEEIKKKKSHSINFEKIMVDIITNYTDDDFKNITYNTLKEFALIHEFKFIKLNINKFTMFAIMPYLLFSGGFTFLNILLLSSFAMGQFYGKNQISMVKKNYGIELKNIYYSKDMSIPNGYYILICQNDNAGHAIGTIIHENNIYLYDIENNRLYVKKFNNNFELHKQITDHIKIKYNRFDIYEIK